MKIQTIPDRDTVRALLLACDLPTADIGDSATSENENDDDIQFWACYNENENKATPLGIIGLQTFQDDSSVALLRSLVVQPAARRRGIGKALVQAVESQQQSRTANNDSSSLYLLTTTATDYFACLGYQRVVDKTKAATVVRNSSQFSSLCPCTAILMKKTFGNKINKGENVSVAP